MTKQKIFVPETAYHYVFEALPEGGKLVAEPEPDVELAVLGMQHAPQLSAYIDALPRLQVVQSLNAGVDWYQSGWWRCCWQCAGGCRTCWNSSDVVSGT
jgi:hypothetical protein